MSRVGCCITLLRHEFSLTSVGSTGDNSGNLTFGIDQEAAILFPEVEVNYDVSVLLQFHAFISDKF